MKRKHVTSCLGFAILLPLLFTAVAKPDPDTQSRWKDVGTDEGWLPFDPPLDDFDPTCPIDLRYLNEKVAGEKGRIFARDGRFLHSATGEPVRFWAVNGPPRQLRGEQLQRCARMYAKRGVNLVRVYGGVFDSKTGSPNLQRMEQIREIVGAMRDEGIYTHLSIYFPLWFTPNEDLDWLKGYDGSKHPFSTLYFNDEFESRYREWWRVLLTEEGKANRKALIDEPALMGVELVNEDSYFFWTFSDDNIPDPQLRILERQFGDWLTEKYGSLGNSLAAWNGASLKRDVQAEGRIAFRPLWNIFNEKTKRDLDTVAFLLESQMSFYRRNYNYLRYLGFEGLVTCSNWTTASAEILGPLEKYSYTAGDFMDRHGYFGCLHKGPDASWSIRNGHTYRDRSGLRFDSEELGKDKSFSHPVMDVQYNALPSMISETTFPRPNRYRTEAPLFYSVYGALQGTDCIAHFDVDGSDWEVKPQYWMQPWTLMSPTQMGQFPAAALIYRQGLIDEGDVLANVHLKRNELLALNGTPLPQDAAFDELRLADVPQGLDIKPGDRIDPLIHFAGRTRVTIDDEGGRSHLTALHTLIDRDAKRVRSSTGQLRLDYGRGLLSINAPMAQGAVGAIGVSSIALDDVDISSELELGAIVAVSLDDKPLAFASRILLQVMSEEKTNGFKTVNQGNVKRIVSLGTDPWLIKRIQGTVRFKRPDASGLSVIALDGNGDPKSHIGNADEIQLLPDVLYYLITGE